ncbi:bifunctional adenosylcobinamide kinase/adenosylcobinamide-phosphate guanylyltransferase [bacterium]|uniref:bifunctional adenosylcobinamide kinase/adenosylcobinamide-phosphate guanylyltransferase n=1 Tax=Lachnospiraceae TaxID=186803 RepID=UPI002A3283B4|nr:bifunctional adenosylcobinamide kinase/adenosylcobinamide-phosphate guanylyltransferase [bacterium]MDY2887008.1 bifunctional adenosylcobinamide kinase/adenosylcobinamide-phosphate guanylyltransferase [Bariatricus sp.]MCI7148757.1 bifunctional adenosylcobinamide kinase/adenosylcobinamide-phosphate guanylyltransferase [bacterium]MDD6514718.1 bifunctional adenosylcobinamide kinase/adenosylcobinamide-phosphate guanylyltransferase [bacterium]MDD7142613.1 bifunctional adenosylcobinamide kinase/ade
MRMIIGGAFQGKMEYAQKEYPGIRWVDGAACSEEELLQCEGVYHFHLYIRKSMEKYEEMRLFADRIIRENPQIVIITDEIGYGLVPIDAFERRYREETGRICTRLAAFSERVDRVVCGIGLPIKGGDVR